MECLVSGERRNQYLQVTTIKQPKDQRLGVEEKLRTCGDGNLHKFYFINIVQDNKSIKRTL